MLVATNTAHNDAERGPRAPAVTIDVQKGKPISPGANRSLYGPWCLRHPRIVLGVVFLSLFILAFSPASVVATARSKDEIIIALIGNLSDSKFKAAYQDAIKTAGNLNNSKDFTQSALPKLEVIRLDESSEFLQEILSKKIDFVIGPQTDSTASIQLGPIVETGVMAFPTDEDYRPSYLDSQIVDPLDPITLIAKTVSTVGLDAINDEGKLRNGWEKQFLLGAKWADHGASEDYRNAAAFFWNTAPHEPHSAYNLGILSSQGKGIKKDENEAASWFEKAARVGMADAQFNLALRYATGRGVDRDLDVAGNWLLKAAKGGVAEAQYLLGLWHYSGKGVDADPVQAYAWLNVAAGSGFPKASAARGLVASGLTQAEIALGQSVSNAYGKSFDLYSE